MNRGESDNFSIKQRSTTEKPRACSLFSTLGTILRARLGLRNESLDEIHLPARSVSEELNHGRPGLKEHRGLIDGGNARAVKGLNLGNGDGWDSRSCGNDLGQCGTGLYNGGRCGFVASGGYVGAVRVSGGTTTLAVSKQVLAYSLLI